jgi:hypothetical protein
VDVPHLGAALALDLAHPGEDVVQGSDGVEDVGASDLAWDRGDGDGAS